MGELIENRGFHLDWGPGRCIWTNPKGQAVRLPLRHLVPILRKGLFDGIPRKGEDPDYDLGL